MRPGRLTFPNPAGHSFTVRATTNLALPAPDRTVLGSPTNIGGGMYHLPIRRRSAV